MNTRFQSRDQLERIKNSQMTLIRPASLSDLVFQIFGCEPKISKRVVSDPDPPKTALKSVLIKEIN